MSKTPKTYDRKAIMKLAWHIYNTTGTYTLPQAIKQAWECHKDDI